MNNWLLLSGGSVFDGHSETLAESTSVLVRDTEIVAVDADAEALRAQVPRGEPMKEIDAAGKTVMPGLIDAHCHMTYGESLAQEEMDLYNGVELRTLIAAANAKKVLRAGVTSISQPGGSYYIGVGLRDGINMGLVEGPHMFTAGRYISTSNGLTDYYPTSVGSPQGGIGMLANTLPEMLAEIRKQVKNGVDLIKLADSPYGQYQSFTSEEMKQIAGLAHQLGKKATIHARGSAEVKAAIEAGFDWIMHGNVMTDDVIEQLAESKIPLVPTLLLLGNLADFGDLCGSPAGQRDGCRRMLEKTAPTLHKAREAGVKFVAGTDTGFGVTPYGEWHARELELLVVYAGLSNVEALRSMTSGAAVTVNGDGVTGEIAPNRRADIIVVNGNPLKNLALLVDKRNIETVVKAGTIVEFDDEEIRESHHHPELVYTYSTSRVTYEAVYGDGPPEGRTPVLWDESAQELAHALKSRELDARAVVDA